MSLFLTIASTSALHLGRPAARHVPIVASATSEQPVVTSTAGFAALALGSGLAAINGLDGTSLGLGLAGAALVMSQPAPGEALFIGSRGEAEPQPRGEDDVECFLVDGVEEDGKDFYVCTSQPEETAWFMGVPVSDLRSDYTPDASLLQCEAGTSFNGEPEWLCTGPPVDGVDPDGA